MKVMSILGTRPELIKMSEIIKKLDKHTEHIFVHTGQNHDYELHEVFYRDLGLRKPDIFLECVGETLGETIANVIEMAEGVLIHHKPDAVVILGDTNSGLAGIIAKRMKIPFFHLEAGNRCFDDNVPEEINRRLLDHIADVNMVYTQNQRLNLMAEGLPKERTFVMGSPMKEVLSANRAGINSSTVGVDLGLLDTPYFLVSIHRDENVEIEENLIILLDTLNAIAEKYELPVIVSTHPRLRRKLEEDKTHPLIRFMKPFGFLDYNRLQLSARCVISDSGTIAEESSLLGFPAITIRNTFERIEAVDVGAIQITGVDRESILNAIDNVTPPTEIPTDYNVDNCSDRVVKVVLGYTPYINKYVWRKR